MLTKEANAVDARGPAALDAAMALVRGSRAVRGLAPGRCRRARALEPVTRTPPDTGRLPVTRRTPGQSNAAARRAPWPFSRVTHQALVVRCAVAPRQVEPSRSRAQRPAAAFETALEHRRGRAHACPAPRALPSSAGPARHHSRALGSPLEGGRDVNAGPLEGTLLELHRVLEAPVGLDHGLDAVARRRALACALAPEP